MNVVMINIGPHEAGTTNSALREVAVGPTEYSIVCETLWVGTNPIQECTDCGY